LTTLNLLKKIKINLTQGYIEQDQWSAGNHEFEITPKDFLRFSKQDLKTDDKRGSINALTNAKRAIDCQTDKVFFSIGIDPNKFPSVIENFIAKSKKLPQKDLPIRLRFLQAINFAPAKIIADARQIRHNLEHFYKRPSNDEVSRAIELAELFIQSTESKLRAMMDFSITDTEKYLQNEGRLWESLYIKFNSQKGVFSIEGWIGKVKQRKIYIKNTSEEFYYLLKIATSFGPGEQEEIQDAVKDWIENIGHPIPRQHIKIDTIF
jgi:hypothetical protein